MAASTTTTTTTTRSGRDSASRTSGRTTYAGWSRSRPPGRPGSAPWRRDLPLHDHAQRLGPQQFPACAGRSQSGPVCQPVILFRINPRATKRSELSPETRDDQLAERTKRSERIGILTKTLEKASTGTSIPMSFRPHSLWQPVLFTASTALLLGGCVADEPRQVNVFCWAEAQGVVMPEEKWMRPPGVVCTPIAQVAATTAGPDRSADPAKTPDRPSNPGGGSSPDPGSDNEERPTADAGGGGEDGKTVTTGGGWRVTAGGGRVTITPTN